MYINATDRCHRHHHRIEGDRFRPGMIEESSRLRLLLLLVGAVTGGDLGIPGERGWKENGGERERKRENGGVRENGKEEGVSGSRVLLARASATILVRLQETASLLVLVSPPQSQSMLM